MLSGCSSQQKAVPLPWFTERGIEEIALSEVLNAHRQGKLRLPLYQRDSVWSEGRVCGLWDSLLRGFPIPSFLLVEGKGNSRDFADNGVRGATAGTGSELYYDLLDGQQRLSAIIAGTSPDATRLRLWVDLAPPPGEVHPLRFAYWLHPCTKTFPFGFHMKAGGEHDFQAMSDEALKTIWNSIQHTEFSGKDYYELPLDRTFPWEARCPVPLARLVDPATWDVNPDVLPEQINKLSDEYREPLKKFKPDLSTPDPAVLDSLIKGLKRVREAKLALQYIDLANIEQDEEDNGGHELFTRIGRGGVQITARQLAVSKLMLTLGKPGNDALVAFQKSKYGLLLETEDVVHALARVALAEARPAPAAGPALASGRTEPTDDLELLDLNLERLHKLKKGKAEIWETFQQKLSDYCGVDEAPESGGDTRLGYAFRRVFERIEFHPKSNPFGFSLLQLAGSTNNKEGITPITLHPLLVWQFKHPHDEPTIPQRNEMLRWMLFANGICADRSNIPLNREIFNKACQLGQFSFTDITQAVFRDDDSNQLRQLLGFRWTEPRIAANGTVEDIVHEHRSLPTPLQVVTLSAKRLLLNNTVHSGVGDFVLMWNQRLGLYEMYGETHLEHIPALFGKGRPFDADHIVPRSRFLYQAINDDDLKSGVAAFFEDESQASTYFVRDGCFRKHLPNMQSNYRYWPKYLNRADGNCSVKDKLPVKTILSRLNGHPLYACFTRADQNAPWLWSAIPVPDQATWEQLPPDDNQWDSRLIEAFISCLLKREYFLYGEAYKFLTGDDAGEFNYHDIIKTEPPV